MALICLWPIIGLAWYLARRDTGEPGFFIQERIGRHGHRFRLIKIRTMRSVQGTTVTTANDTRITALGAWLRRWKVDELPQLWNVLKGDMSFVGPRPDVSGFMDQLRGDDREILQLRPGITGPATLKYRNEEELLATIADPETYNSQVIWPDKVRINRRYLQNWTFYSDLVYMYRTVVK